MMVNICIKEILPAAFSSDPRDKLATNSFLAGMAIMAVSLVLFTLV
jgi:ZIP family zinc transporter